MLRSPRRAGYTLVEIIVVVLLIGILAGLAAPRLQRAVTRLRVAAALNQLAGDLYLARMLAAREGVAVELRLETNPDRCVVGYRIQRRDGRAAPLQRRIGRDHLWLCLRHNGGRVLVFNARGLLRSGAKSFWIASDGRADSLVVSWVGRVRRTAR